MSDNTTTGGYVRFDEPCAAAETAGQSAPPSQRVNEGTLRHTAGGSLEEVGHARYTATQDGVPGGSVMQSLRQDGPTKSVELEPGNPSSRTSLEVALRLGAVLQIAPGVFADVPRGNAPEALQGLDNQPAELPGADPGHEFFDAEDSKLMAEILEPLPQHSFDAALASGTLATIRGADLSDVAKGLSQSTGMEPERALAYCEAVGAYFERSAMASVVAAGVPEPQHEAFKEYCREHPNKLHEALERMLYRRDLSGFQELAKGYRRANPGDLSAFHAAGFETHVSADGELMIKQGSGDWVRARDLK